LPNRPFETDEHGVRLYVRLTPRGGRDAIDGVTVLADGRAVLKARVRAAPEKGAANSALEALIAKHLGVPRSAVSVMIGATSRLKTVRIAGSAGRLAETMDSLGCA
jgi:uncharacterized protein YggU (UPF0235/DUF167 family)